MKLLSKKNVEPNCIQCKCKIYLNILNLLEDWVDLVHHFLRAPNRKLNIAITIPQLPD